MVLLVRCFLSVFFLLLVSALDLDVYPMADPKSDNTCSEGNVTQAYLVNGRSYQFHCPCKKCEWTFDGHFHPSNTVTDTFRIETVTPEHNGKCLYCRNVDTTLYTVFNLTARDLETMSFAVDDLEKNCSVEDHTKKCSLKDQTNKYYDFSEHRPISNLVLSVSCKVTTGYPPFKSIQWNISDGLEDLSPCVFYTDNNQTLNINMDLYEDLYKIYTESNLYNDPNYVTCVVDNGIESLIGRRRILMSTHSVMTWFYYYPLSQQTLGVVTMDPGGYASVVCASQTQEIQGPYPQDYRICLVNYTHLGPSQRCSRGGIAPDMQCCNTRAFPHAPWCQNYTHSSSDDSIPVSNLTTNIEGNYQCQVWNPMMEDWQSIGDPVQVEKHTVISTEVPVNTTEIQKDTSSRTTPFLYLFVAAVCLLCILIPILLVIIFAIFIKYRRMKSHSTASCEDLMRDNLLGTGMTELD